MVFNLMRKSSLLIAILFVSIALLGSGCLEEKSYPGAKTEQISSANAIDLVGDGTDDYGVYDFSPVVMQDAGMVVQRQVTVSAQMTGVYTSINPNLTDLDLLQADQSLDEFSKSRVQSDAACSNNIGLMNVVCSDIATCSKLCSSANLRCKKMAASYDEVLAGSMISYVQDNSEIRSLILDARRMVVNLRGAPQADQDAFMEKMYKIIYRVASVNSNPLYTNSNLALCNHSDFGVPYLLQAASKIGTYTLADSNYRYRVVLSVKPLQQKSDAIGIETTGISLSDTVPRSVVPKSDAISSIQSITAAQDATNNAISWSSAKASKEGYLLAYEFWSEQPPENVLPYFKSPNLKVKRVNLTLLVPVNAMYMALTGMLGNYYMGLGLAVGITIAAILIIYNILVLGFAIISERVAGATFVTAFRRAFGRTDVKWKTSLIMATIIICAGVYAATMNEPSVIPALPETIDYLLKSEMGMLGTGLIAIGTVLLYMSFDNFVKILILERAYGMVIKQEKDMFLAKAATLKNKIAQLGNLITEYSKDDFDVSKEYDTLTSLKADNVDVMAKEMTGRTKALVEENLSKAEGAINTLSEKRRIADENWAKWKEIIAKGLEERGEVYVMSLVTVPASLRTWSLGRYMREEGDGLILERDVLKRKQVSAEGLVRQMINSGLLRGAIVMKQEKVLVSEFSEAGSTVASVLALKLRAYVQSLAKNMGQHQPQSFVSIGDKTVLVMMKGKTIESVLLINKPKFNEAIEQWKASSRSLEAA